MGNVTKRFPISIYKIDFRDVFLSISNKIGGIRKVFLVNKRYFVKQTQDVIPISKRPKDKGNSCEEGPSCKGYSC